MYEEYDPGDACFSFFQLLGVECEDHFNFRSKMTFKPQKDFEI